MAKSLLPRPPMVGRATLTGEAVSRLQRPDDVRDDYGQKEFKPLGYYGLGGIGKSRLLYEIRIRFEEVTPYVCFVDFDPRGSRISPGTAIALLCELADQLQTIDRGVRRFWQRREPFAHFWAEVSNHRLPTSFSQSISIEHGEGRDITQTINIGGLDQMILPGLMRLFSNALSHLHRKSACRRQTGIVGKAVSRPLIGIILDSVDLAPRQLPAFLSNFDYLLGSLQTRAYHVCLIAAGRQQIPDLTPIDLPPLDDDESNKFITQYFNDHYLGTGDPPPEVVAKWPRFRICIPRIVKYGQGIPLLLQMLTETAFLDPTSFADNEATVAQEHVPHTQYVIGQYLNRLRHQAGSQNDDQLWISFFLLLCGAVPRVLTSSSILRALLMDLPGTPFNVQTNYDSLFDRLRREAYWQPHPDGGLVLHTSIRASTISFLQTDDFDRWRCLHDRAAGWYCGHENQVECLYHRLRSDLLLAIGDFKFAVVESLRKRDTAAVQELLQIADDIEMPADDNLWITLFKADLAKMERNDSLALERLRRLYNASILDEEVATRLEQWLTFNNDLEAVAVSGAWPNVPDIQMDDLLWWSQYRKLYGLTACIFIFFSESQLHADEFPELEVRLNDVLPDVMSRGYTRLAAEIMCLKAEIAIRRGDFVNANMCASRSIELLASHPNTVEVVAARTMLARTTFALGRNDEVCDLLKVALYEAKAARDRIQMANVLAVMGDARRYRKYRQYRRRARRQLDQANDLFVSENDVIGEAWTNQILGEIAFQSERYSAAVKFFERADATYKDEAYLLGRAHTLHMLGILAGMGHYSEEIVSLGFGRLGRAERFLRDSLAIYRNIDDAIGRAHLELFLVPIAMVQHRPMEAAGFLENAHYHYEANQHTLGAIAVLLARCQIVLMEPNFVEADRLAAKAYADSEVQGFQNGMQVATLFREMVARKKRASLGAPVQFLFVALTRIVDTYGLSVTYKRENTYALMIVESRDPYSTRGFGSVVFEERKSVPKKPVIVSTVNTRRPL